MEFCLQADGYEVIVAPGARRSLSRFLEVTADISSVFILTDSVTRSLCLPLLLRSVPELSNAVVLEVAPGERTKTLDSVRTLCVELNAAGADRQSLLICLGGGMVGDLGGFTASVFLRGIRFVQLPTTLLSMVDASVGGKTGVDLDHHKNLIGTFSRPEAVFIDTDFLMSLPSRQIRSGLAEIIKHSIIGNVPPFVELPVAGDLSSVDWLPYIISSVSFKNEIVSTDFMDRHQRKLLNFGHTVGHALEARSNADGAYPLLHGEAVALGMEVELALSARLAGFSVSAANRMIKYLRSVFGDLVPPVYDKALVPYLLSDKKNSGGIIRCVLLGPHGNPIIDAEVGLEDVRIAIESLSAVSSLN
ncbi:MAG: 3-dehydroquinate synthase [Bacteroidota bacterium]|jgi:3-dehydroquinate synthase